MGSPLAGTVCVLLLVAGCAGNKADPTATTLWESANQAFEDEAWDIAIQRYKLLLDQHPFDSHAENAELRVAQSYYLASRFPEAIASFENFERMHPTSGHLPMVEYHRGMSYAMQHGDESRDQRYASSALTSFRNVIDRFPTGPWAQRAELRIRECREALARHEGVVADFYLYRSSLRSAEARLAMLLTDFHDTDAAATWLERFAAAWDERAETEAATLARATLVYHHAETVEGRRAAEQLAEAPAADPLPDLLAWIDQTSSHVTRLDVPRAVSAFPDAPPGAPQR